MIILRDAHRQQRKGAWSSGNIDLWTRTFNFNSFAIYSFRPCAWRSPPLGLLYIRGKQKYLCSEEGVIARAIGMILFHFMGITEEKEEEEALLHSLSTHVSAHYIQVVANLHYKLWRAIAYRWCWRGQIHSFIHSLRSSRNIKAR